MFIEEYGLIINIVWDETDDDGNVSIGERICPTPPKYTGRELEAKNGVVSLNYNGETIADAGVIWKYEGGTDDASIRFDSYRLLNKTQQREYDIRPLEPDEDVCEALIEWARDKAESNELHEFADALQAYLVTPKYTEAKDPKAKVIDVPK